MLQFLLSHYLTSFRPHATPRPYIILIKLARREGKEGKINNFSVKRVLPSILISLTDETVDPCKIEYLRRILIQSQLSFRTFTDSVAASVFTRVFPERYFVVTSAANKSNWNCLVEKIGFPLEKDYNWAYRVRPFPRNDV